MDKSYRHISFLFIALLLLVFWAFYRTYFSLFPTFASTSLLVHAHAVTVLLWFAMLIGQPILIRRKRVALHRFIGKISYGLIPLMVICFLLMARQHQLRSKDLMMFAANFSDISLFLVFYGLAIGYRHTVAYHGRFMIMTVLPFLGATIGRLPSFPISSALLGLLIILGLLLYERVTRRIYKPYFISLVVFMGLLLVPYGLLMFAPAILDNLWSMCFTY